MHIYTCEYICMCTDITWLAKITISQSTLLVLLFNVSIADSDHDHYIMSDNLEM